MDPQSESPVGSTDSTDSTASTPSRRSSIESPHRESTLCALFVLAALKGADVQLLPSSFRAMESDLHLSPSQLGMLALCQGVACAITGPFWANLVDSGASRKQLLKYGAALWGICTFQLALTSNVAVMVGLRVINGTALAMMVPVMQSFVADLTTSDNRGQAFGKVACAANVGQVMACLIVTPLSERMVFGMRGWRVALVCVGLLSLLVVLFVHAAVHDVPKTWKPRRLGLVRELRTLVGFMQIPTFRVIVMQGIFGTIPSAAQSFTTMYLQYLSIPNSMCGLILALRTVGEGIGSALGGYLGDTAHARCPNSGRIMVAMFSVLINTPFLYVAFMGVGRMADSAVVFAGVFFVAGVLTTWEVPGCLNPVLVDIVPKRHLSSAFAWNVGIVFTSGNTLGPILVGFAAQKMFHYKPTGQNIEGMSEDLRERNAEALGQALATISIIPCMISAVIFSMLFCTYPKDKRTSQESASDSDLPPEVVKEATETTRLLPEVSEKSV
eukprot:gb/GFBE01052267.1/.p1 GENE.gb/GFBE01052267.1/~~gb/GFBE01052267.1/.p1  ORF type:complete len:499 (+),score=84.43 gb/GFBE01052267.1/:1-1497(+)